MTTVAEHKKKIREHLEEIEDAISIGIERRPVTIGFHTVACAIEMLELFLHKKGLISTGKTIKHAWFKRPRPEQKAPPLVERKLPVSFEGKEKLYELLYALEENRSSLIYGRANKSQIELMLKIFMEFKRLMVEKLEELDERIE